MRVGLCILLTLVFQSALADGLRLIIKEVPSKRDKDVMHLEAFIQNHSSKTYKLVAPGDGSRRWSRTPFAMWSASESDRPHPIDFIDAMKNYPADAPTCASQNAMKESEIFKVEPGQTRRVPGWGQSNMSRLCKQGRVRVGVRYYYKNDPQNLNSIEAFASTDTVELVSDEYIYECPTHQLVEDSPSYKERVFRNNLRNFLYREQYLSYYRTGVWFSND